MKTKILIMGAAGRDFHNFNTVYRGNKDYEVVAFTATQIPNIDGRKYPAQLAGKEYPQGIPIESENQLTQLIKDHDVDEVVFSYSDVPHEYVMHKAAEVNAAGAKFTMLGAEETMVQSTKPLVSVCAVRTGCGKSQTTRAVCEYLINEGKKVVAIRHPMPYGDLVKQEVQRFATYQDMLDQDCTIEEMEEYEPHINQGIIVYAGVDYEKIIRQAETEADVIVWDGGNNDTPFYKSDLEIVIADPHRAGHELTYYPGETNFRRADAIIINKVDSAKQKDVEAIMGSIQSHNPNAEVIKAESEVTIEITHARPSTKLLVVEDGPTLTHGEMTFGAGIIAAQKFFPGVELSQPESYSVGTIKKTYEKYSHMKDILPAMGYGDQQIKDLEDTINASDADMVLVATPIDLEKVLPNVKKKMVRVYYAMEEESKKELNKILGKNIK